MRPQEGRRFADEAFYFDGGYGGELVVDEACLDGNYPSVEAFDQQAVIATYQTSRGGVRLRNVSGLDNTRCYGGERLVSLEGGDQAVRGGYEEEQAYQLSSEATAQHVVQPTDLLLVQRENYGPRRFSPPEILTLPATEYLPDDGSSYRALGLITDTDKLVVWGYGATHSKWLVDLAIASDRVQDAAGLFQLQHQVGGAHLVGLISTSETVTTYLDYFAQRHGKDFMPTQDARDRWEEFPDRLSWERSERYLNER